MTVSSSTPRPSLLAAAATSAFLCLLFIGVYSGCNYLTSLRIDVGTWYYEWERYIPFVPLMIVPYMSIDLFFVAAPFLCQDGIELRILARRISFAILTAGTCFLLMPLRMGWNPPPLEGWLGSMFGSFCSLDQFNLCPSLHIALRTILAYHYGRRTRGALRFALQVWFSLIGFSTLLAYRHHTVDVIGGFILAAWCFYLIREEAFVLPVMPNFRVAGYYAAGAIGLISLAHVTWPWGGLLLWPAIALGIVALGYAGVGPGIYRKRDGRLPLSTRVILAPVLLGQYLSLRHYRRQCRAWDEVVPAVWIGRKLNESEAADAIREGVTAVLDLTVEFSEAQPFSAVSYRHIPVMDLTAPTPDQLGDAVDFITEQAEKGTVYVHCKVGYSRSAAVIGAYLLQSGFASTVDEAVMLLRNARPSIVIRPEAMTALREFAAFDDRELELSECPA
jgi:protein-tyrosine phosphatase/membrane-associated phospholipid phosphatase